LTTSASLDGDDEEEEEEVEEDSDDVQYSHQLLAVAPRPPLAAQTSMTMMVMDMTCRRRSFRAGSSLDDDGEEREFVDSASVNERAAAAALKSMARLVFVVVDAVVVALVLAKTSGVRPAAVVVLVAAV